MQKAMEADREATRRVGEGTRREREETRRERELILLWEICDRVARGMYYFLISLLMAYHSGSCLNDSVKENIKRSKDEKLKQASIDISSKDNRLRYCAHLENFFSE